VTTADAYFPANGGITLFIVPCVFSAVEEWKWNRNRRKQAAA
jgi:hypothetical protein